MHKRGSVNRIWGAEACDRTCQARRELVRLPLVHLACVVAERALALSASAPAHH